ncbi:TPA: cysteine desulfurase NifS [Candidatus Gastranaerophilales bacterium HUM_9]|nr:MAG TPA: cysteine desulfurase NifS [Candidatus Gastranaerophilales bacterium HUM_9]HBX35015.1 cysteine desulfurase NifS [Cyanobacteria bacterium UBA11440]
MMVIYLDNNATTRVDDKVLEVMLPYLKDEYANPSSMYEFSTNASKAIDDARHSMKDFLGANNAKEIVFTSCGSESANTAIKGAVSYNKNKKHIITTKVEHPCVLNTYKMLEKQGYKVDYIGVNSNGELELDELKSKITPDTALVSVMWANNETGVIFPIKEIGEIIKSKNPETLFFVDAVQAAGKIDIDVKDTNIDMLGVSGHKFHAPKGIGALYVNSSVVLPPLINGGHQERGYRAGTENVPYIVGMGKAAELAIDNMKYELSEVKRLRDKLETGILKNIFNARLNTSISNRVPNTTNIGFEYVEGELILLHLSDIGVCASSGSACTSGSLEPSHVLRAMGTPFTSLHGSIRFSLSRFTTEKEIDYVLDNIGKVIGEIVAISPYQEELEHLRKSR